MDGLIVYPDHMMANMDALGGLHNSQRVLLALTQAGMAREVAYRVVQRSAMQVWQDGADFLALLKADADVADHLDAAALESLFDLAYHTAQVDTIFARVFSRA